MDGESADHRHPLTKRRIRSIFVRHETGKLESRQMFRVYLWETSEVCQTRGCAVAINYVCRLLAVDEGLDVEAQGGADAHDVLAIELLENGRLPCVV